MKNLLYLLLKLTFVLSILAVQVWVLDRRRHRQFETLVQTMYRGGGSNLVMTVQVGAGLLTIKVPGGRPRGEAQVAYTVAATRLEESMDWQLGQLEQLGTSNIFVIAGGQRGGGIVIKPLRGEDHFGIRLPVEGLEESDAQEEQPVPIKRRRLSL